MESWRVNGLRVAAEGSAGDAGCAYGPGIHPQGVASPVPNHPVQIFHKIVNVCTLRRVFMRPRAHPKIFRRTENCSVARRESSKNVKSLKKHEKLEKLEKQENLEKKHEKLEKLEKREKLEKQEKLEKLEKNSKSLKSLNKKTRKA